MDFTKNSVLEAVNRMPEGGNLAAVTWEASGHTVSGTNKQVSEFLAELHAENSIRRVIICGEHVYKTTH